jgi:hypothetical protein
VDSMERLVVHVASPTHQRRLATDHVISNAIHGLLAQAGCLWDCCDAGALLEHVAHHLKSRAVKSRFAAAMGALALRLRAGSPPLLRTPTQSPCRGNCQMPDEPLLRGESCPDGRGSGERLQKGFHVNDADGLEVVQEPNRLSRNHHNDRVCTQIDCRTLPWPDRTVCRRGAPVSVRRSLFVARDLRRPPLTLSGSSVNCATTVLSRFPGWGEADRHDDKPGAKSRVDVTKEGLSSAEHYARRRVGQSVDSTERFLTSLPGWGEEPTSA